MEFPRLWVLRGANIWARCPVLEVEVDLGDQKATACHEIAGFNQRLAPGCLDGMGKGRARDAQQSMTLAHALQHVTLELQMLAGSPVGFGYTRTDPATGHYRVIVEYEEEELGRACLEMARDAVPGRAHDQPSRWRELNWNGCASWPTTSGWAPALPPSFGAARQRDIPVRRLNEGSLVQLGQGARQRRICTAETDRTGAIAEAIAQDKQLTRLPPAGRRRAGARGPAGHRRRGRLGGRRGIGLRRSSSSRSTATTAAASPPT